MKQIQNMKNMRSEHNSELPKSEESPGQKQDPLERRRLQNRLSQRNHRRKIRDRIAKLQERVLANELRANAVINGWNQTYTPPFLSMRHSYHPDASLNTISSDHSPLTSECSPFIPPCTISTQSWPSHPVMDQSPILSGNSTFNGTYDIEPVFSVPTMPDPIQSHRFSLPSTSSQEGSVHNSLSSNCSPLSETFSSVPTNQALYYAATETSLPQILEALSTVSPQSKIIVVVSPETTISSNIGSPTAWLGSSSLSDYSLTSLNALEMTCDCQDSNMHCFPSTQTNSRIWNSPRSYNPGFPIEKPLGSSCGIFPTG